MKRKTQIVGRAGQGRPSIDSYLVLSPARLPAAAATHVSLAALHDWEDRFWPHARLGCQREPHVRPSHMSRGIAAWYRGGAQIIRNKRANLLPRLDFVLANRLGAKR